MKATMHVKSQADELFDICQATNRRFGRSADMFPPSHQISSECRNAGFRVALPRPSEALGSTLLSIYARDRSLPSDMIDLLSELDRVDLSR